MNNIIFLLSLCIIVLNGCQQAQEKSGESPLNVLFITVDDL